MPPRDLIVIGASAGGVETLRGVIAALPRDLPAAVFVVMHFPSNATSVLPQILARARTLTTAHAADGEPLRAGRVYVAPPGHHLMIENGALKLTRGPAEHGNRPAINATLRSAADCYGDRVVGVVLTGMLDDGSEGLAYLKERGGTAVVQDPNDALFASMPQSALESANVDHVVPVAELPALLVRLVSGSKLRTGDRLPAGHDAEPPEEEGVTMPDGDPSGLTCPQCQGALFETKQGDQVRFRCHVGHTYGEDSLDDEQARALDVALWTALRSLQERVFLTRQLASLAKDRGQRHAHDRFTLRAEELETQAIVIRRVIGEPERPELLRAEAGGFTAASGSD